MNVKLLGAFVLVLLLVLGLPLLVGSLGGGATTATTQAPAPKPSTPEPKPAPEPAAQFTPPDTAYIPAPSYNAPMLTEASLIGTAWLVSHQMGQIEVQLYGGNSAVAKHPLVGELQATWRVQGSNVVVNASLGGRTETIRVQIRGNSLYYDGVEITRTR